MEAREAFSAAAEAQPRNASAWFGAGIAAYMLGQNSEAEAALTRALQVQSNLTEATVLLGDLQYRSGRIADALATYEAGLKHAPHEPRLTRNIAAWTAELKTESRFIESRGAHFRVLFEGPADQSLARRVVDMLETAYWRVGGVLTVYPAEPVDVVLYTQQQFRDVTRSPSWAAGAYDGRIRIPVRGAADQAADLERVLTHEFVHALVASLAGRSVPVWINEGLATTFEPGGLEEATRVLAASSARLRLSDLHRSFAGLSALQARIAYAQSTVAVRKILELRGAAALVVLLRDLAAGVPFDAAFHQRVAMPYPDFQQLIAQQ